jgi:hypothetical protein
MLIHIVLSEEFMSEFKSILVPVLDQGSIFAVDLKDVNKDYQPENYLPGNAQGGSTIVDC